jgi:hypothetical protein
VKSAAITRSKYNAAAVSIRDKQEYQQSTLLSSRKSSPILIGHQDQSILQGHYVVSPVVAPFVVTMCQRYNSSIRAGTFEDTFDLKVVPR